MQHLFHTIHHAWQLVSGLQAACFLGSRSTRTAKSKFHDSMHKRFEQPNSVSTKFLIWDREIATPGLRRTYLRRSGCCIHRSACQANRTVPACQMTICPQAATALTCMVSLFSAAIGVSRANKREAHPTYIDVFPTAALHVCQLVHRHDMTSRNYRKSA
jgi:hypothetical protein